MRYIYVMLLAVLFWGCQENEIVGDDSDLVWTIDTQFMRQGCYGGRDCIPSLENPDRSDIKGSDISFLDNEDLVVGIWNGSEHIAYPHSILDWHEIVNEDGYTISYCPLTGSAIHIATPGDYGVSGLLYNSNLIMYDRETESFWPQMLLKSAAGDRSGGELHLNSVVETTWGNWKLLFPGTKVVNSNTGYSRNYSSYPYGNYKTCNSSSCGDYIYFPVVAEDDRLDAKKRVLTLINDGEARAIDISAYPEPQILNLDIGEKSYVIAVSGNDNIAVAFETVRNIGIKSWDMNAGELILEQIGTDNQWDITGTNLSDPAPSERLKAANGYIAYWFSVAAFYPDVEIIR